jgi:hypothetical protein
MTKGHPRDYRWFELHPERTLLVRAPYPSEGIFAAPEQHFAPRDFRDYGLMACRRLPNGEVTRTPIIPPRDHDWLRVLHTYLADEEYASRVIDESMDLCKEGYLFLPNRIAPEPKRMKYHHLRELRRAAKNFRAYSAILMTRIHLARSQGFCEEEINDALKLSGPPLHLSLDTVDK